MWRGEEHDADCLCLRLHKQAGSDPERELSVPANVIRYAEGRFFSITTPGWIWTHLYSFCGKRRFSLAVAAEKALRGFLQSDVTTSPWKEKNKTAIVDVTRHAPHRSRACTVIFARDARMMHLCEHGNPAESCSSRLTRK